MNKTYLIVRNIKENYNNNKIKFYLYKILKIKKKQIKKLNDIINYNYNNKRTLLFLVWKLTFKWI